MLKWTRKTTEFEYAPYISQDGRFRVQDMDDCPTVEEYDVLRNNNWNSAKSHEDFLAYCRENNIKLHGANWALVDNKTNQPIKFPFRTAKAAKEYAENI